MFSLTVLRVVSSEQHVGDAGLMLPLSVTALLI